MRDGVYLYMPSEIGVSDADPMIPIPCFRPASEVVKAFNRFFDLKKLPICVTHPDNFLDFDKEVTWENGSAENPNLNNNSNYTVIDCEFHIKNKTLDNYLTGVRQLSCGWEGDFEKVMDTSQTNGCEYIQRFRDINHIAMVENGRCGDLCKINDSFNIRLNDADLTALEEGKEVEAEHKGTLEKLYKLVKEGATLEQFIKKGIAYIAGDHIEELGKKYYYYLKRMEQKLSVNDEKNGGTTMSKRIEKVKELLNRKGVKLTDAENLELEKEVGMTDDDDDDDDKFKKKYSDLKKKYDKMKKDSDEEEEEVNDDDDDDDKKKDKKGKKTKDKKKRDDDDDDDDAKVVDAAKAGFEKGKAELKKTFLDGMEDVAPILAEFKPEELKGLTPCAIKALFIKKESGEVISDAAPELNAVFKMVLKNRTHPAWKSQIKDNSGEKSLAETINEISFVKEAK